MLKKIFTWWSGATLGTLFTVSRRGRQVGQDDQGNRYFEETKGSGSFGRKRRWVIYAGYAESSRVPPEWHGWLHHTFREPPEDGRPARVWMKPHEPNLSGTPHAYHPKGSLHHGDVGAPVVQDYEAWTPEGSEV